MRGTAGVHADTEGMVSMCSLSAGTGLFGIDIKHIREVLGVTTPQPVPLAPQYIAGVIPYRGEALTTLSLRVLLGLESGADAGNVIVLDDSENGEQYGLLVDSLTGVVTMPQSALETDPQPLDAENMAYFDGVCKVPSGLMVRLDVQKLRPSRLALSGLPGAAKQIGNGELK